MSYCRFQNTLRDLQDCNYALDEAINGNEEDKLSREEAKALIEMADACEELLEFLGYVVESEEAPITSIEALKENKPEILDF